MLLSGKPKTISAIIMWLIFGVDNVVGIFILPENISDIIQKNPEVSLILNRILEYNILSYVAMIGLTIFLFWQEIDARIGQRKKLNDLWNQQKVGKSLFFTIIETDEELNNWIKQERTWENETKEKAKKVSIGLSKSIDVLSLHIDVETLPSNTIVYEGIPGLHRFYLTILYEMIDKIEKYLHEHDK